MPKPSLVTSLKKANQEFSKLKSYRLSSCSLSFTHQALISELVMFRLYAIFEMFVSEIAWKLCTGAPYTCGISPTILCPTPIRTQGQAITAMLSFGRSKPIKYPKWSQTTYIVNTVKHVMDANEKFIHYAQAYGAHIDEMTSVRHYIAHASSKSKVEYQRIISRTYGNNYTIQPGKFLISPRHNPPKIDQYITYCSVIISDLAKGN